MTSAVVPGLRLAVLGPLQVQVSGRAAELSSFKQQSCLALLLCRANRLTPVPLLIETMWPDEPPRTAHKGVQVYIAGLRRLFGAAGAGDRITHRIGGYVFTADAAELDVVRFEEAVAAAREARGRGDAAVAAALRKAVVLWRGPVADELRGAEPLDREADRLTQLYLSTVESWAQAEIALGNADAVTDRLVRELGAHPLRERLAMLSMTALAQSGRPGEALGVYAELRQTLSRELGLRPSAALRELNQRLLTGRVGIAGSAPAPAPTAVVLPADPPHFVGRPETLAQLGDVLARWDSQLVLLTGSVGVGKTATAVHLAHRLRHRFPDGRVFVRMRDRDGAGRPLDRQLATLLRLTGCPEPPPADPQLGADQWRAWAAQRRMLVILDDAPSAAALRALLPEGGRTTVLVTSRSRLAGLDDCERVPIGPLPVAEATALLGRLIGADRLSADPPAAERIARAVGLTPLAIHRAAVRLQYLRHAALADFAGRLESGSVLAHLDSADGELSGRFTAALGDLTPAEGAALRRLAGLDGVFGLSAAAAALGQPEAVARRSVETLIEWNAAAEAGVPETYEVPALIRAWVAGV